MKILMVTREQAADRRYGLGKSLAPVCAALRGLGHEVGYLSQAEAGPRSVALAGKLADLAARLPGLGGNPAFARALAERLNMGRLAARLASREGYTHVHLHDPWIALGYRLFRRPFGPERWGLTEHGFGCYSQAALEDGLAQSPALQRRLRALEARLLRRAGWCVFPSAAALRQTARDLCFAELPPGWQAVPHAVPPLELRPKAQARRQLGWAEGRPHVLAVGRLAPLKRFPLVLEAVARLPRAWDAQAVILGGGDPGPLAQRAAELGIAEPLILATDDVGLYLSAADAYVSASATESFGLANLEAMAAGLPCVLAATPAVAEVAGAGACLAAGEAEALASALQDLLSDPARAAHYAQAARARAAAWPSIETIAKRYAELYQTLA
jgi:glycosyltransferase involved in cell wall biosynthesis